jgi:IclR family transcriptional regulator, pca regulon regulatory protein
MSVSGESVMPVQRRRTDLPTSSGRSSRRAGQNADAHAGSEYVQALERGFAVIRAFSADTPNLTIAGVARRAGLTRAAARRYLLTLQEMGCVRQTQGAFSLTARLLDLGFAYLSSLSLPALAEPFMENVVNQLHESCSMSVLDGREIVYVARMPAKRIMSINLVVGSRLPAHATSMGKVLLAYLSPKELDTFFAGGQLKSYTDHTVSDEASLRWILEEVRQRGWALTDAEFEEGVRSVGAPVRDRSGRVLAAINVSAHASRVSLAKLRKVHLPILLDAAAGISGSLGALVADTYLAPGQTLLREGAGRGARFTGSLNSRRH